MKKKQYEKPTAEKISFCIADELMGGDTADAGKNFSTTEIGGDGEIDLFSFDGNYKLHY